MPPAPPAPPSDEALLEEPEQAADTEAGADKTIREAEEALAERWAGVVAAAHDVRGGLPDVRSVAERRGFLQAEIGRLRDEARDVPGRRAEIERQLPELQNQLRQLDGLVEQLSGKRVIVPIDRPTYNGVLNVTMAALFYLSYAEWGNGIAPNVLHDYARGIDELAASVPWTPLLLVSLVARYGPPGVKVARSLIAARRGRVVAERIPASESSRWRNYTPLERKVRALRNALTAWRQAQAGVLTARMEKQDAQVGMLRVALRKARAAAAEQRRYVLSLERAVTRRTAELERLRANYRTTDDARAKSNNPLTKDERDDFDRRLASAQARIDAAQAELSQARQLVPEAPPARGALARAKTTRADLWKVFDKREANADIAIRRLVLANPFDGTFKLRSRTAWVRTKAMVQAFGDLVAAIYRELRIPKAAQQRTLNGTERAIVRAQANLILAARKLFGTQPPPDATEEELDAARQLAELEQSYADLRATGGTNPQASAFTLAGWERMAAAWEENRKRRAADGTTTDRWLLVAVARFMLDRGIKPGDRPGIYNALERLRLTTPEKDKEDFRQALLVYLEEARREGAGLVEPGRTLHLEQVFDDLINGDTSRPDRNDNVNVPRAEVTRAAPRTDWLPADPAQRQLLLEWAAQALADAEGDEGKATAALTGQLRQHSYAWLRDARAEVKRLQQQYGIAQDLRLRGDATTDQVNDVQAQLRAAQQTVKRLEVTRNNVANLADAGVKAVLGGEGAAGPAGTPPAPPTPPADGPEGQVPPVAPTLEPGEPPRATPGELPGDRPGQQTQVVTLDAPPPVETPPSAEVAGTLADALGDLGGQWVYDRETQRFYRVLPDGRGNRDGVGDGAAPPPPAEGGEVVVAGPPADEDGITTVPVGRGPNPNGDEGGEGAPAGQGQGQAGDDPDGAPQGQGQTGQGQAGDGIDDEVDEVGEPESVGGHRGTLDLPYCDQDNGWSLEGGICVYTGNVKPSLNGDVKTTEPPPGSPSLNGDICLGQMADGHCVEPQPPILDVRCDESRGQHLEGGRCVQGEVPPQPDNIPGGFGKSELPPIPQGSGQPEDEEQGELDDAIGVPIGSAQGGQGGDGAGGKPARRPDEAAAAARALGSLSVVRVPLTVPPAAAATDQVAPVPSLAEIGRQFQFPFEPAQQQPEQQPATPLDWTRMQPIDLSGGNGGSSTIGPATQDAGGEWTISVPGSLSGTNLGPGLIVQPNVEQQAAPNGGGTTLDSILKRQEEVEGAPECTGVACLAS